MGLIVIYFFLLCAFFFVPIGISKWPIRASWRSIGIAYLVWYVFLVLFMSGGSSWNERFSWAILMAMLYSIVGIPVITLVMRLIGRR